MDAIEPGRSYVVVDDLTRVLGRALDDAELRRQLTATARPWVERERSWAALSGRVEALYETLLAGVPLRGGS